MAPTSRYEDTTRSSRRYSRMVEGITKGAVGGVDVLGAIAPIPLVVKL